MIGTPWSRSLDRRRAHGSDRSPGPRSGLSSCPGFISPVPSRKMTGMTRGRALTVYVATVIAAGLGLLIGMAATGGIRDIVHAPTAFWVFAIFPVIGESFPILIPRANGEADETTMSTTFAFALVLAFGPAMAAITQAVASCLADAVRRKELWKIAFNVGQYTLSIGAAGAIYRALGGDSQIG